MRACLLWAVAIYFRCSHWFGLPCILFKMRCTRTHTHMHKTKTNKAKSSQAIPLPPPNSIILVQRQGAGHIVQRRSRRRADPALPPTVVNLGAVCLALALFPPSPSSSPADSCGRSASASSSSSSCSSGSAASAASAAAGPLTTGLAMLPARDAPRWVDPAWWSVSSLAGRRREAAVRGLVLSIVEGSTRSECDAKERKEKKKETIQ